MDKNKFKVAIWEFFKRFKQYRPYGLHAGLTLEKVWNNGMGSLSLFRFDLDKKNIVVNTALANKSDMDKLQVFIKEQCLEDFTVNEKSLGYPNYYIDTL